MNNDNSTVDDSRPQSVLAHVDAVCGRFEEAWLSERRPRIEDYLGEALDEQERDALLKELIALDVFHRQQRGEAPTAGDYQRFSSLSADWLASAIEGTTASPQRYRLGERIGRGGIGEVLRGRDLHLNRELAIKVLREEHRGEAYLQRLFLEEARIGGRLQHPGIVPVHDLSELPDGRPFFTMKLVQGRTLAALLAERPDPATDLPRFLSVFEQVCQTLAYAHSQGIIHRDLKPLNVMVGAFGEVQVMDWGLAKVLKRGMSEAVAAGGETVVAGPAEEDTTWQVRTQQGQTMGTPAYMPPEQARGEVERMDKRSDVFGLGAILCEILTGRPPFTGANKIEMLAKARACDHAEALVSLDGCGADTELVRLAKKCLAPHSQDRPGDAGVVAREVAAYLAGVQERLQAAERERAAAQARAEEARKTAAAERRARKRMVLAALVVVVTVATALAIVMQSRNEAIDARGKALTLADEKGKMADEKGRLAEDKTRLAEANHRLAKEKEVEAHKAQREATLLAFQQATTLLDRGDIGRGMHRLAQSLDLATRAGNDDLEQASRTQLALWRSRATALKMLLPHSDEVLAVAFSPNGQKIFTGGADKTARLWDATTGELLGEPFRAPPARIGSGFGVSGFPGPMTFPRRGFGPEGEPKYAGEFVAVAFSPDGRVVAAATGDPFYRGRSRLVDYGDLIRPPRIPQHRIPSMRQHLGPRDLSPRVDLMSMPPVLWDTASRKPLLSAASGDPVWAVAFSPDGRMLLTGGGQYRKQGLNDIIGPDFNRDLGLGSTNPLDPLGRRSVVAAARLWDVSKGKPLPLSLPHDNAVLAVAFSPDGQRILTGSADQTARMWDAATGRPLGKPLVHDGLVVAVAFSPDGQTILTCSQTSITQAKVHLWSAATRQSLGQPLMHPRPVLAVAFSPDGRTILTGSGDPLANKGEAHLWDVATGKTLGQPLPHPGAVHSVAWSPDGRWILTGCADKIARLWEAIRIPPIVQRGHHENTLAYSPDGRLVLLGTPSKDGQRCEQVSLSETASGKPRHRLPLLGDSTGVAAFSPDSRKILLGVKVKGEKDQASEMLLLVDAPGSRLIGEPFLPSGSLEAVAVSPDGQRVLTGSSQPYAKKGEATLWDAATGKILRKLAYEAPVLSVAFSSDGRTIATGSGMPSTKQGEARLYDATTGQLLKTLPHNGPVRVVLFNPDGRTLATAGDDRTARLWAVPGGEPCAADFTHNGPVRTLAFRADGGALLTGSDDQTARLWDVVTGKALGEILTHQGAVRAVAISRDGRFLATGSDDRTAQVWEAATGRPLGKPLAHQGPVISVTFGSDGHTLLTRAVQSNTVQRRRVGDAWETTVGLGWASTGRVWQLPVPMHGDPDSILLWTQVLTGFELDTDGSPRPLDAQTWQEHRGRLGQRGDPSPTPEALLDWHRRAAKEAEGAGQWFAAAWHLERLGDSEPASEFLHTRRGRAYSLSNRWQQAVRDLTKAIESGDKSADVRYLRGLAHAGLNQNEEAVADFSQAIDLIRAFRQEREAWVIWFHRARAFYRLGQMDKVIGDLSQVIAVNPGHGPSWHGRGMAQAELDKLERAGADLTTALQKPDAPATTWCDLALVRLRQGNENGYRQACITALERFEQTEDPNLAAQVVWTCSLAPDSTSDSERLVRLAWRGFSDETNGDAFRSLLYDLWERSVRAGVSEDMDSYVRRRALSAALYRAGKFKEAVQCASFAMKLRKEPAPSVWLILALAHERDGKPEEAKRWLEKARTWIAEARRAKPDRSAWDLLPWPERLALERLEAEAEKRLKEGRPMPEKSGR
jgi:WD40 repeat protein/serine/threonine protein kinase/tetratricopeptide (TPR) repeat protein